MRIEKHHFDEAWFDQLSQKTDEMITTALEEISKTDRIIPEYFNLNKYEVNIMLYDILKPTYTSFKIY